MYWEAIFRKQNQSDYLLGICIEYTQDPGTGNFQALKYCVPLLTLKNE